MARAFLTVTDLATNQIVSRVDIAISTVEDFRPVWRDFKGPWHQSRLRMARTQGVSTGARWPSYMQTAERRQYRHIKAKITGVKAARLKPLHWENGKERLLPSLYNNRHPDNVWREMPRNVTIGTRVPYARNHDKGIGASPNWRNLRRYRIPKRPLLRIGLRALSDLNESVSRHAGRVAGGLGTGVRVGVTSDAVRSMR